VARLKHYLEYFGSKALAAAAQSLSAESADRFGARLGAFAYHLLSGRRKISNENIRTTIGQKFDESEIESITKSVFQNIGRTLIEIARFGKMNHEAILKLVRGDTELLKKIQSEGKGCIILTCHYGNWELLGSWPAALGFKTDFLVGTQHNTLVNAQLNAYREKLGVGIIPSDNSLRGIFKSLKQNHFIGIAADQHSSAGIKLKFLGKEALHARGPALFSIRTGAPICPIMLRRERHDRHVAHAAEPIYPRHNVDEEEEIIRITTTGIRFFEDFIRKYPEQWAWTHRRWKLQSN
jgi:KDO2-lipid IV(A) lauroyltransferase